MMSANPYCSRLMIVATTIGMIAACGIPTAGQEAPAVHAGYTRITGLPDDWSHHRQVFSDPGTEENAIQNGTHDQWFKVVNDPRYVIHRLKRNLPVEGPAGEDVMMRYREAAEDREIWKKFHRDPWERRKEKNQALERDWSMSLGSGAHLGAGQYPAKYSFSTTTALCSDFVVYPTGLAGGSTQATIVAYNNLYGGTCGAAATRPNVAWAYNTLTGGTGSGGLASLSPVVSGDGTQVAYIQQVAGAAATLVVLKPSPITGANAASPTAITWQSNANYRNCVAPCYTTITLNGSPTDTLSAPFPNYAGDILYVGDHSGKLHKFTGVFNGTPGEVVSATAPVWPITVSGNVLTSPVYDSGASGNIFVADSGGFLYSYSATTAANQMTSSRLTNATNTTGIVDAPMVDSTTEEVYVAVGDDANTATSGNSTCLGASGCSGVFQFAAGNTTKAAGLSCTATNASPGVWPTSSNCGEEAIFGTGAYPTMYDGDFDNAYYTAGTGKTGILWECPPSNTGGIDIGPRLAAINMQPNGGIVPAGDVVFFSGNTVTAIPSLTSGNATAPTCSPVTEFYNTGNATPATTYTAAISGTGSPTTVTVGSNTNLAIGNYILIGSEIMLVTGTAGTTSITVARAQIGTTEAAHAGTGNITIPAVDYIYLSVTKLGTATPGALTCTGGACLYSIAVGTASGSRAVTGMAPTNAVAAAGGTSGIVIDNSSTSAGASQIYYTTLSNQTCGGNGTTGSGSGGCAVQTSQSAP
jgi:hypothetical protein